MSSVTNASFYNHVNDSGLSFQQPSNVFRNELKKTSSFPDLTDLQSQLETQKKLRQGAQKLLEATENDIANGKYGKNLIERQSKRLGAQAELDNVNREIMLLQRKIEAVKRIQAQEMNSGVSSSFSNMKNDGVYHDIGLLPPNPIHNVTFASAHSSSNSTPLMDDGHSSFSEDDTVLRRQSSFNSETILESQGTTSWFLSELLQTLGQKNQEETFYIEKSNQVVDVLKLHPKIVNSLVFSTLGHRIQFLLMSDSKEVIACGYRIARYVINDIETLRLVKSLRIHCFLIHSLTKSSNFTVEREQAIKLIRRYLDINQGHKELSVGVVKILATIVNSGDDEFKELMTETLAELLLLNASLVYEANGISAIMKIINDGDTNIACLCGMILLKVLDYPDSRRFLRNGEELGSIVFHFVNNFAYLTDTISNDVDAKPVKIHLNVEKLHNSAFMISSFLKTWVGLAAFSVNKFDILKTLIQSLSYDIPILRDILMDIFYDILKIRSLPWINGPHKKTSQTLAPSQGLAKGPQNLDQVPIVTHYTTVLLAILLKCGLVEKIVRISQTCTDDLNRRKSMVLMVELFSLSVNLLPFDLWAPYFQIKSDTSDASLAAVGASQTAAFQIDKFTRKLYKGKTTLNISPHIFDYYRVYSENVASAISSNLDDAQLRRMIDDTKVLFTKRFIDWRWDIILELLQGPLKIGKKFEDCLKYQYKFMKKMMSFYRPFKKKFMLIKKTKNYQKYINAGVALFECLISHNEGIKYLSENKLLPQIAECLAQVDPISGLFAENPIFSVANLKTTLSSGYFKMLGVLSKSTVGLSLMNKWKMFSIFHHIINMRGREDLILAFITEFDYNRPSQLRIMFEHTLVSCESSIRILTTRHLANIVTDAKNDSCSQWAAELLVNQLYDPDMEVCNIAVQILDVYCLDTANIARVVKYKPSLNHLGNIGAPLLLRFLSTPMGFNDLLEIDFIENEMREWFERKNDLYVLQIEDLLESEYMPFRKESPKSTFKSDFIIGESSNKKMIPHHFYGELVKTTAGFALLKATNDFQFFVDTIKELFDEYDDEFKLLKLKSCMWAVGHIGFSELASSMVDESGIIATIIQICRNHPVCSIRGTAFFVLGLLSNISEGLEVLDEHNWDVALDVNDKPSCFCVPKNLEDYFSVDPISSYDLVDSMNPASKNLTASTSSTNILSGANTPISYTSYNTKDFKVGKLTNPIDKKIYNAITSFNMTPTKSMKLLTKLEANYKERFASPNLYMAVLNVLESYSFKLSAQMFILQLFSDKLALENLIKRDRSRQKR